MGLRYLTAAGYRPLAASRIWERLMAEEDATALVRKRRVRHHYAAGFFADHPTELTRATYLRDAAGDGRRAWRGSTRCVFDGHAAVARDLSGRPDQAQRFRRIGISARRAGGRAMDARAAADARRTLSRAGQTPRSGQRGANSISRRSMRVAPIRSPGAGWACPSCAGSRKRRGGRRSGPIWSGPRRRATGRPWRC